MRKGRHVDPHRHVGLQDAFPAPSEQESSHGRRREPRRTPSSNSPPPPTSPSRTGVEKSLAGDERAERPFEEEPGSRSSPRRPPRPRALKPLGAQYDGLLEGSCSTTNVVGRQVAGRRQERAGSGRAADQLRQVRPGNLHGRSSARCRTPSPPSVKESMKPINERVTATSRSSRPSAKPFQVPEGSSPARIARQLSTGPAGLPRPASLFIA